MLQKIQGIKFRILSNRLRRQFAMAVLAILFIGCGKIENFNSTDEATYGEIAVGGSPEFQAAQRIIIKKCTDCHQHSHWAKFTEEDYLDNSLAESQSLTGSPIYFRNKNAVFGDGPRDMPTQGRPSMTVGELEVIEAWINTL